ncbi:hypothetical protein HMPREF1544_09530 [Mucor circinelloides 1006PhL]|uniref:Uncharacterized protein n=1 Tax=Mucor circinelloides f. circinelloides (strain 1006PhL) TaxID=1220926 RepID=S2J0Y9_MUCC1|nr:hypothetical protein HMPREF1544_09530 [Mucor circinelloides 1006PhL]
MSLKNWPSLTNFALVSQTESKQTKGSNTVICTNPEVGSSQGQTLDLAILLRNQFPDALGLRIRNVNQAAKYFEINFRTNEASREDITIVRVSVKNLPYEGEIILKEQMSSIFGDYAGEMLKITFAGMKPACNRCHVTDHVFSNCSSDHFRAKCPDAFWNQRKKAAKLNSAHTSPTQPKPVDKAAANTSITPAKANDNKKDNDKVAIDLLIESQDKEQAT